MVLLATSKLSLKFWQDTASRRYGYRARSRRETEETMDKKMLIAGVAALAAVLAVGRRADGGEGQELRDIDDGGESHNTRMRYRKRYRLRTLPLTSVK
jgi:hypothetical protein